MKPEDLRPVTSTVASHAGYDPQRQEFHVRYQSGAHFKYLNVPVDKAETVLAAQSFGASLNRHILGRHKAVKL